MPLFEDMKFPPAFTEEDMGDEGGLSRLVRIADVLREELGEYDIADNFMDEGVEAEEYAVVVSRTVNVKTDAMAKVTVYYDREVDQVMAHETISSNAMVLPDDMDSYAVGTEDELVGLVRSFLSNANEYFDE